MAQKRMEPDQRFGTPAELLFWSKDTKEPLESQRLLGIRMLMLGSSREDVMRTFGISWSTLQKWVRLWNKGGRENLRVGKPTGRPQKLSQDVKDFLVREIEFIHPKTGKRITGVAISGTLKKNLRDQVKQKCDLLLSSSFGIPPNPSPEDSAAEE